MGKVGRVRLMNRVVETRDELIVVDREHVDVRPGRLQDLRLRELRDLLHTEDQVVAVLRVDRLGRDFEVLVRQRPQEPVQFTDVTVRDHAAGRTRRQGQVVVEQFAGATPVGPPSQLGVRDPADQVRIVAMRGNGPVTGPGIGQ